jgi:hypothetical protein
MNVSMADMTQSNQVILRVLNSLCIKNKVYSLLFQTTKCKNQSSHLVNCAKTGYQNLFFHISKSCLYFNFIFLIDYRDKCCAGFQYVGEEPNISQFRDIFDSKRQISNSVFEHNRNNAHLNRLVNKTNA